ncbi:MAG TPA: glycosyltransferase family 39 protein [Candidatus Sulfomarinibacteraceae bacterium]|nr:glycosyltransferase family 39 protein [Candidatus Sulfomarinibacteraceae bacterium]
MTRKRARWVMVAALLVGAALRFYGLYALSPPGLAHDEVANWLIDRAILAGEHTVYFTEAYGHEAGYHYLQAAFVALLGDHALALRLPSAFLGLLLVAASYALARRLFGRRVALVAALFLAVLFYPVFYSRLGLRAILLPVLSAFSAYFWWRGWGAPVRSEIGDRRLAHAYAWRYFVSAGVFAGLSLHSYMAARAVPIFYLLFVAYLGLFHRHKLRARWRGVVLFWLAGALAAAPLVIYLLANPGAEFRISEVDAPLRALFAGDLQPVVDNSVDILGAFGFAGDPLWRQNVASTPLFDPLLAAFFYLCLPLCAINVRDERYAFLILWLFSASIPSIVTIDAPSSIRIINILPVLTLLPAIVMHNLGHLSTKKVHLSTAVVDKWIIPVLVVSLFLFHAGRTARATFVTWPDNDEVRFVWQEALADVGHFLEHERGISDAAIGGWTPDSMDPPTMALSMRRDDVALRHFNPQEALLIPAGSGGDRVLLYPQILPLHPLLEAALAPVTGMPQEGDTFLYHRISGEIAVQPQAPARTAFGDEVVFLGHSQNEACGAAGSGACQLLTYWRVLRSADGPRRFFLHLFEGEEGPVVQGDALGAPAEHWRAGDLIIQRHALPTGALAPYEVRLGVYHPQTGRRLLTPQGNEYVTLGQPDIK